MKPRGSRVRRALLWSLGAAAALVFVVALIVWRLLGADPSWWDPAEPSAPENVSRGEYLENQVVTAFHKVRSAEARVWTLELDADWINAWFATRLPLWAANRNLSWTHSVHEVNVNIDGDRIRLGVKYGAGADGQAYSVEATPTLAEDGKLELGNLHLRAGRLPLPLGLASNTLTGLARAVPELQAVLAGRSVDPVVRLSDGRRVAIRSLRIADDRIVLRLETLADR